jgi:hypothetical protein
MVSKKKEKIVHVITCELCCMISMRKQDVVLPVSCVAWQV